MQTKFKIGDKVRVLTKAYPLVYDTEGVVTKVDTRNPMFYVVERNTGSHPEEQYGAFDHDSWRYCFYESELELVEDKPKFKVGDLVVHPSLGRGVVKRQKHWIVINTRSMCCSDETTNGC